MSTLKRILFAAVAAVALLLPQASDAQSGSYGYVMFANYDVASTSFIYGVFGNAAARPNVEPFGSGVTVGAGQRVSTSGSSTTISAVTAGTLPFQAVAVGDLLIFPAYNDQTNKPLGIRNIVQQRVITAKASGDSVTVNAAIDLTQPTSGLYAQGFLFSYKNFISGTTTADGWFPVGGARSLNILAQATTVTAASLDFAVDCKMEDGGIGALPNQVYTKSFGPSGITYPANTSAIAIDLSTVGYDYCRVGWRVNTDAGTQSVYTFVNLERTPVR